MLVVILLLASSPALAASTGSSGLPIPRFVSLKPAEVNVRTGPGTRYPIAWVYRREGMPVEIVEEFDLWRKIRDIDGTTGWVHKTMLDGRRNAMINTKSAYTVRAEPKEKGRPLFKVEKMVIVRIVDCEVEWCRIQAEGRKGWVEKKALYGVYPNELID